MTHLIQLHSFDGGIHPAENKHQSTQRPIQPAPLPDQLVLPLGQHIGAPSDPIVNVGDSVLKGQLIAEPKGFVSVGLHAPTSGVIKAIELRPVPHASGLQDLCVVIEPDGKEQWIEHQSLLTELGVDDLTDIDPAKVVDRIRGCGIAGMGGAGFPTSVKLTVKRDDNGDTPIDTLILNGAECEPYITADDMLMRERAEEVLRGAQVLMYLLSAKRCMIGVEDNKPEAIAALNRAAESLHEEHHIDVVTIPTKYPSGGEKQLIQILTGKEVPSGGIPAQLGIVCQNVGTASAIYRAVYHGEPLISRITTVTGDTVADKGNWEVLLGTPVSHLLELSGYRSQKRERVVMGGPMMGFALPHTELPVVKTTNCLLAPTEKEMPLNDAAMACIRCGMCTEACPAQLLPQQLYWFSRAEEFDKAEQHNLFDCIECGACSYVCPSQIPLVQYYRHAKGAIREERAAQAKSEKAKERYERRLARQEREIAEKEAKRKARADAAAKAAAEKKAAAAAGNAAPAAAKPAAATSAAPATSPELEKLQKQLTATQTAIAKTKEKLSEAKQAVEAGDESMQTKVDTFTAALEKSQTKMKALAKDIAAEKKALKEQASAPATDGPDKGDPNSPERLKRKWETAQARLDTALKRLEEAKAQGLDTVEALQTGIDKQQVRVDEAKAAYEASVGQTSAQPSGNSSADTQPQLSAEEIDALQKKLLAQQDKLAKMEERLATAKEQGLDTVDAIAKGVEKQRSKVEELQQQLPAASAPPAPAAEPEVAEAPQLSAEEIEALQKKLLAQQDKLAKMEERLATAKEQGLDTVDAIAKGVEKARAKVEELQQQLPASEETPAAPAPAAEPEVAPEVAEVPQLSAEEIDALQKKLLAQQDKLAKMEERLTTAKEQGLDTVDAIAKGVEKARVKVAELQQQLPASEETPAEPEVAEVPQLSAEEIDALHKKLLAQQDKLAKMEERLEMAKEQGLDTIEAINKGVVKQRDKLTTMQQQLAAVAPDLAASLNQNPETTESGTH